MIGLLQSLVQGEGISTIMPLPEDEASWANDTVVFATANGYIRRNALSDFTDVRANGKIAMKFEGEDAGDRLIAVAVCSDDDDVLLSTHNGRSIRFPVGDVRVFTGRSSVGVRGIRLLADDRVISMSILHHAEIAPEVRDSYLSMAAKRGRAMGEEGEVAAAVEDEPIDDEVEGESKPAGEIALSDERFNELASREEFLLSITERGFGARSSAYDYRITGRGGQGLINMTLAKRQDHVVAVFAVTQSDQIMLVTDGATVIRCPVFDIRMARRPSQGVVV